MSLASQLTTGFTRVATEIKAVRAEAASFASSVTTAVTNLNTAVTNLNTAVTNEGTARSTADATLQSDIDTRMKLLEPLTTQTTTATLTTSSDRLQLCDATSAAFTITLPATTTAGKRFLLRKIDSPTNVVTIAGTFLNASGSLTNLKLYGYGQWFEIISTTTSGTWKIVENSAVAVPSGTSAANLPDGTLFIEYTP